MIFTKLRDNPGLVAVAIVALFALAGGVPFVLDAHPAEAQLPPPVAFTAIVCEEAGVEVTYEAARYDLPGEWKTRNGRPWGMTIAWRIDLGNGEEVVTTAPCRLTRPAR